jgi:hypothetical protein
VPSARSTDPETSHQAAESIDADTIRVSQASVLYVLASGPMTDEELLAEYGRLAASGFVRPQSVSGIRTRRNELVSAGWVIDTGRRAQMASGRSATVWAVNPRRPGLRVL